jgi:hypothetical protein
MPEQSVDAREDCLNWGRLWLFADLSAATRKRSMAGVVAQTTAARLVAGFASAL